MNNWWEIPVWHGIQLICRQRGQAGIVVVQMGTELLGIEWLLE